MKREVNMVKDEVKAETKKEVKPLFELGQVATQHAIVIVDNAGNRTLTIEDALVQILNDLAAIKKGVVG